MCKLALYCLSSVARQADCCPHLRCLLITSDWNPFKFWNFENIHVPWPAILYNEHKLRNLVNLPNLPSKPACDKRIKYRYRALIAERSSESCQDIWVQVFWRWFKAISQFLCMSTGAKRPSCCPNSTWRFFVPAKCGGHSWRRTTSANTCCNKNGWYWRICRTSQG